MAADDPTEQHLCLDCGVDISHRRWNAQRCELCSKNRESVLSRQRANRNYRDNRTSVLQRAKSRQQTPDYKQRRQNWEEENPQKLEEYKRRKKQGHREKTGYNPEGRTCEDCKADISHMGHRAKRCERCSTPPTRTCLVCGSDISKRGSRAVFCREQCTRDYHQTRESTGYTKTCTKCGEIKQHTEFGMHSGLRRSSCKICEVKDQSERYRNATPEQTERRNRLKRELEQDKRANRSQAEKTMLRTETRRAHRRKLYGPDFDENQLYLEQDRRCAICRSPKALEELEVDHDHETERPRGFLCKNCNFKLLSGYENKFPPHHQDSPYLNAYLERGKLQ